MSTSAITRGATPCRSKQHAPLWLQIGFWLSIVISVVVVILRLVAFARPPRAAPPQLAALDAAFASQECLIVFHILSALVFVLIVPLAVFQIPAGARWPQRLLFPMGAVVGLSAYVVSVHAIGGWTERSAVLAFNSLFLYSLFRAYLYGRCGEHRLQRRWTLRGIAILLGIATMRPVMGVFFATSSFTHLAPSQFFGIAFWIGFSVNLLAFEVWLRFKDSGSNPKRRDTLWRLDLQGSSRNTGK